MSIKNFIQQLVGTKKIVIENVQLKDNDMIIIAHTPKKEQHRCPICGRKAKLYDNSRSIRRWRCQDIGSCKVYIKAPTPRVKCREHGVITAAVPWAEHNSRFCRNFESTVAWLAVHTSKKAVSELMRVEWHTVGNIVRRVSNNLQSSDASRFDNLVNIGIDETSYKKGHKYMTVVINHDTASVIWCGIGHGKEVLSKFFKLLSPEQRASIRCVSADGARWIASCIEEYCPNAERCVDPFHVVSWVTDTLDNMRRSIWQETKQKLKATSKTQDSEDSEENVKKQLKSIKGFRYALLKNPEDLSEAQLSQLELLVKANPKLYRAYLLKEALRTAIKSGGEYAETMLRKWMGWAQRCRIDEFRALREKIKRNFDGIISAVKHKLSNARMEAINNKIKLIIRKAYGFRNTANMIAMIMLACSDLKIVLPGR